MNLGSLSIDNWVAWWVTLPLYGCMVRTVNIKVTLVFLTKCSECYHENNYIILISSLVNNFNVPCVMSSFYLAPSSPPSHCPLQPPLNGRSCGGLAERSPSFLYHTAAYSKPDETHPSFILRTSHDNFFDVWKIYDAMTTWIMHSMKLKVAKSIWTFEMRDFYVIFILQL